MTNRASGSAGEIRFLWAMLAIYMVARLCQLYADQLPTLPIVLLHVIPTGLFAIVHGRRVYGWRGIGVFAAVCIGTGSLAESLSLRTGFPFGHYYFTDVMGPKVFQLPVLLALAYLGIGYAAWVLAMQILGYAGKPVRGLGLIALPLLASILMTAWDVAMDPDWSTVDRAWVWTSGGPYFGVPISNFAGWLATAYVYYQFFALYCRARRTKAATLSRTFWGSAIVLYGVCALGNLLIVRQPMAPPVVMDGAGRPWLTRDILLTCSLVSLLIMVPAALAAWRRLPEQELTVGRLTSLTEEEESRY